MRRFIQSLMIAILVLAANASANAAPPLSTIQKAKDAVESARYQLPVEAGYGLVLTQLSYDSKTYSLVYRYHYTIPVTKPTSSAIREAKQGVIHFLKANPNSDDMQLLRNGITFHYNYYDTDGDFIYAIKITPSDIK